MAIRPDYVTIGSVFNGTRMFHVPKYQRSYAWMDDEVEDFCSDLLSGYAARVANSPRNHFFGGIVCVEGPSPGAARNRYEVVDGQQRLATFVMLVSQVIARYQKLSEEATLSGDAATAELTSKRATSLRNRFISFEDEENRTPIERDRVSLSGPDIDYFKQMILYQTPLANRDSHKRLKHAFATIGAALDKLLNSLTTINDKLGTLEKLQAILDNDYSVILIVTDARDEAYRLFQVLNNRGLSLTEGDLLRARTLEILSSPSHLAQQGRVESAWNDILSDSSDDTVEFLRTYYASLKGKRPTQSGLFDDFMAAFFYKGNGALTNANADSLVSDVERLQSEIHILRPIKRGEWPVNNAADITIWEKDRLRHLISELRLSLAMPLLLAGCKIENTGLSALVGMVSRFMFRYKIICNQHVSALGNIFLEHSVKIRLDPAAYNLRTLQVDLLALQSLRAPDAKFKQDLSNLKYQDGGGGNKPLKYFLLMLEYYFTWYSRGATGAPTYTETNRSIEFGNTTIEHIYPRRPATPDPLMEPLVNTLGNLTILPPGENNLGGNLDYAIKKPLLEQSTVRMNLDLTAKFRTFDSTAISSRQAEMIEMATKIFVP